MKFQKKLLSENRSLIAQTVASYVHPQPGNPENSPVGYYVARFDENLVKSIPQGAVPKMGDGIFQYAVRLAYETDEQGNMRRDKNNAPVLKYDENGRPIVTEIVQEISATSAPFYGSRTRWATSAYQYNSSAHPMDDSWYYGPNDEDPSDNASAATPDNPNGGKSGCWLQVPKNLSGEKLYTAELVVFGDVVDADSFVAAGNGRNFIGNFCAAAAEKSRRR